MSSNITIGIVGCWRSRSETEMLRDLLSARLQHLRVCRDVIAKIIDISELDAVQTYRSIDFCVIMPQLGFNWSKTISERLRQSGLLDGSVWFAIPEARNVVLPTTSLSDTTYLVFTYSEGIPSFVDALCRTLEEHTFRQREIGSGAQVYIDSGGGDVAAYGATIDKRQGTYITGETVYVGGPIGVPLTPVDTLQQAERQISPTVEVHLLTSVFPTTYAYHLDSNDFPFVICRISSRSTYSITVIVECAIEEFGTTVSRTVDVPAQTSIDVDLLPMLKHQSLSRLTEIRPASLRLIVMSLGDRKTLIFDQAYRIYLQARDTAVLALRSSTGEITSLLPYMAAWVTPHHPCIEELLRHATDYLPNRCTFGYDLTVDTLQKSRLRLRSQVKAVFQALKCEVGMTYLDASLSFSRDMHHVAQRVRLPAQVLTTLC